MKALLLFVATIASVNCGWPGGPSKSVAGNWSAPGIGHFAEHFELSLTQTDDRITGVACRADYMYLGFNDETVTGDYPRVTFAVSGQTFSGKYEEGRDQIAGNYGSQRIPLRFVRSNEGRCESAIPFPRP